MGISRSSVEVNYSIAGRLDVLSESEGTKDVDRWLSSISIDHKNASFRKFYFYLGVEHRVTLIVVSVGQLPVIPSCKPVMYLLLSAISRQSMQGLSRYQPLWHSIQTQKREEHLV